MIERLVERASSYAGSIDGLILLIAVLVFFWFFIAEAVFFWLLFKFRAKPGQPAQYITGEKKEEKRWISIPHILVLICDVFIIIGAIMVWFEVKQDLPPAERTIRVVGQQWAWTFVDPGPDNVLDTADDIATVDELRIAKDVTYHFKLESKDVLHSFSIPVFRLKQDAVPGRVITGWFKATKAGEYDIQCAEICGIGHGIMGAKLIVQGPEAHAAWVKENSPLAAVMPPAAPENTKEALAAAQ